MTWIDKLEIGLKEDAPFRKDNLPESQVRGPEVPAGPGRSPEIPKARNDRNTTVADVAVDDAADATATEEGMPPSEPDDDADAAPGAAHVKKRA
jgi:hypothetical protein